MITSRANDQIKELVKLQKQAKYRYGRKCFVAEGAKLVGEAAACGRLQHVYVSETFYRRHWDGMPEQGIASRFQGVPAEIVAEPVFCQACGTVTPQGIIGVVSMPQYSLQDIMAVRGGLFLALDGIRDPGNLGTLLRTSEGAGVSGVLIGRGSVDVFNPKVVRSTMGSVLRVPFAYVEDLPQALREMGQTGICVYGTMLEGSDVYDQADYRGPSAIVVGSEAEGISPQVSQCLTGRIRIPMEGKLESLNASVAAAVVLYEAARQRRASSKKILK